MYMYKKKSGLLFSILEIGFGPFELGKLPCKLLKFGKTELYKINFKYKIKMIQFYICLKGSMVLFIFCFVFCLYYEK